MSSIVGISKLRKGVTQFAVNDLGALGIEVQHLAKPGRRREDTCTYLAQNVGPTVFDLAGVHQLGPSLGVLQGLCVRLFLRQTCPLGAELHGVLFATSATGDATKVLNVSLHCRLEVVGVVAEVHGDTALLQICERARRQRQEVAQILPADAMDAFAVQCQHPQGCAFIIPLNYFAKVELMGLAHPYTLGA